MSAPHIGRMARPGWRAWAAPIAPLVEASGNWWSHLGGRDRRIVVLAATLAVALLAYAWIWLPAASGIAALERDMPGLRAQRSEVLAMAQEARGLREEAARSAAAVLPANQRRAALLRSLEAAGLAGAEIIEQSAQRLQLRWARVDYGVWALWAGTAEGELGARFVQLSVLAPQAAAGKAAGAAAPPAPAAPVASVPPGQVSVDAILEWRAQ